MHEPYQMNWSNVRTVTKRYAELLCVTVQTSRIILVTTNICGGVFNSKVAGYKHAVLQNKFSIREYIFQNLKLAFFAQHIFF